jgi:hypothetical protein
MTPFSIVSFTSGYQGGGFYFVHRISNNGSTQLNIISLTLSLDFGRFSVGGPRSLSPKQSYNESCWFSIPSTASPGDHYFTATASFQYYNNSTDKWVTPAGSPKTLNGTLLVLAPPISEAFNTVVVGTLLPISASISGLAALTSIFALKRRRRSILSAHSPTGEQVRSLRSRLSPFLIAGCLVAAAVTIWYGSQTSSTVYRTPYMIQGLGLALLLPVSAATAAVLLRLGYRPLSLLSIVLFSFSATLASTVNIRPYLAATPCSPGLFVAGFPFPWDSISYPFLPSGGLLYCPLIFSFSRPIFLMAAAFFLLDVAFYGAIMQAIMELYHALKA